MRSTFPNSQSYLDQAEPFVAAFLSGQLQKEMEAERGGQGQGERFQGVVVAVDLPEDLLKKVK
jgi:hypothetical protein